MLLTRLYECLLDAGCSAEDRDRIIRIVMNSSNSTAALRDMLGPGSRTPEGELTGLCLPPALVDAAIRKIQR